MPDDLAARLAALEARHTELEQTVVQLRLELEARDGGFRSMRDSRRCPACAGQALLHVRKALSSTGAAAIPLALAYEISVWTGAKERGSIEAFACKRCGLVEFHALDVENVPVDGTKIIAIDPESEPPSDGPFR